MKRTGPTNPVLKKLIVALRIAKQPIWARVADELERPTRSRRAVNLSRIENYADGKRIVLVPGKVLSAGILKKKVTVAAWQFSAQATEKIRQAGGQTMMIEELMKRSPKGENVRIIG